MKKNLHPETRKVVFRDVSTSSDFLINSTIKTSETTEWSDGNTYPLVKVDISSASHPAFTGAKVAETQGSRREAFEKKYSKLTVRH